VIALAVTHTSTVEVVVTGDGQSNPCPTAKKTARLVEPKLP
jgi:hypothetical protein